MRNWIVMAGQPIDTTKGGGFEFFGPYTEAEALAARDQLLINRKRYGKGYTEGAWLAIAIQLLDGPATA